MFIYFCYACDIFVYVGGVYCSVTFHIFTFLRVSHWTWSSPFLTRLTASLQCCLPLPTKDGVINLMDDGVQMYRKWFAWVGMDGSAGKSNWSTSLMNWIWTSAPTLKSRCGDHSYEPNSLWWDGRHSREKWLETPGPSSLEYTMQWWNSKRCWLIVEEEFSSDLEHTHPTHTNREGGEILN